MTNSHPNPTKNSPLTNNPRGARRRPPSGCYPSSSLPSPCASSWRHRPSAQQKLAALLRAGSSRRCNPSSSFPLSMRQQPTQPPFLTAAADATAAPRTDATASSERQRRCSLPPRGRRYHSHGTCPPPPPPPPAPSSPAGRDSLRHWWQKLGKDGDWNGLGWG